jgi:hypothetical protein
MMEASVGVRVKERKGTGPAEGEARRVSSSTEMGVGLRL